MAIAAAVPQLVVGSPHAGISQPGPTTPQGLHHQQQYPPSNLEIFQTQTPSSNIPNSHYHQIPSSLSGGISQGNSTIISETSTSQHHSTVTSTSYSSSVTTSGDNDFELRNKITRDTADGNKDPEKADSSKYPIETYQGLEEATAERIKRFEDETKAMLMRNSRSDLTPATPEM